MFLSSWIFNIVIIIILTVGVISCDFTNLIDCTVKMNDKNQRFGVVITPLSRKKYIR